ncbi:apolipoprotein N-acyltransferase [Thermodesulfatator autotrophicus]|uniref:Apolipoprotein N-acyltransferase n=1 Tax=Thermodesulfatator autotrophicus TaxID=1795632 RepID=A0A177E858_9BACT|nr:apolipoprotein N-acyltransferase [Thermodesulfatator autotrophicus]OAG27681.1 hypothetical protein TH606_05660 [Thermodesulfatator autotrophicus]
MWPYFLAIISGILLFLAHPKVDFSFLAFFALAFTLEAIKISRQPFRLGFLTGFIYFFGLFYWLINVMTDFGGLPFLAAVGTLSLLAAYLALYLAIPFWLSDKLGLFRPGPLNAFFWAALFTVFEFLRVKVPFAFPWGFLGATQYKNLFLIQIASIGGVYAVSFVLYLINYVCFAFISEQIKARNTLALGLLVLLGAYLYGAKALNFEYSGPSQKVALIQGNIPQESKWTPPSKIESLKKYLRLSQKVLQEKPEVIIWPETALPFFFGFEKELSEKITRWVSANKVYLILGAPRLEREGDKYKVFNSLFLIDPKGQIKAIYDKQRLVPFGEFVPFEDTFPFLRTFAVAAGGYSPGPNHAPLALEPEKSFGGLVCFESVFPDLAREQVLKGATALLVATNDAWFRTSAGPYQHFAQAVFRAVENRRYLVRVANTGISGLIDPHGRIILQTPLEKEAYPTVVVKHLPDKSCYTKYGDWWPITCAFSILLLIIKNWWGRRK